MLAAQPIHTEIRLEKGAFARMMLAFALLVAALACATPLGTQVAYADEGAGVVERVKAAIHIEPVDETCIVEDNALDGEDPVELPPVTDSASNVDLKASLTEYVSYDEGVQIAKEAMAAREESFSFTLKTDEKYGDYAKPMFYAAFEEDGDPMHGDYLRWVYDSMSVGMSGYSSGNTYYITYSYTIGYKTTAEEEQATLKAAKAALADLHASKDMSTDESAIRAIYDYICANVTYDYDHLSDSDYRLQYTAYAALVNGTSVCQGYASLLYLMAGLEGLPVRIIAGYAVNSSGNGEGHAWNILGIGSKYYNADSTWDAPRYKANRSYAYYLKSDADFSDHARGMDGTNTLDFTSSEFYAAYPMASTSYAACSSHTWGALQIEAEPTCTESGSAIRRCSVCGVTQHSVVEPLGHEWGEPTYTWSSDNTTVTATRICLHDAAHVDTQSAAVSVRTVQEATCEAQGQQELVAAFADAGLATQRKTVQLPALGHEWDAGTVTREPGCTTDGVRTFTCKRDISHVRTEAIPAVGHVAGAETIENAVEATCETAGSYDKVVRCTTCGEELSRSTVTVPATGHVAGAVTRENAVAPTCEIAGSHHEVVYCDTCGKELSRSVVEDKALGHAWGGWTVVHAATEDEEGLERRVCSRDASHVEERTIPALAHVHSLVHVEAREATCEDAGVRDRWACSVCGRLFADAAGTVELGSEDVFVAALGHAWDEGELTKAPTCTEPGVRTYTCTRDASHTKTEEVPASGHAASASVRENEVAATCETDGSYDEVTYCTTCGEELSRSTVTVPATGHVAGSAKHENEVAATCTNEGSYDLVTRCATCGKELSSEHVVVAALGHAWDKGVLTTAPTCTEPGVRTYTCAHDASHTRTEAISPLGHVAGTAKRENAKAATCTTTGSYDLVTRCTRCNGVVSSTHVTTAALGHSWGAWKTTKKPTLTTAGVQTRVCAHNKNHVQTRSVPKLINVAKAKVTAVKARTFTGKAQKPGVTVKYAGKTLKKGTDYTLAYKNNVKAGTAVITVKGKGAYAGTKTVKFTISKAKITKASFSKVKAQKLKKKGKAVKPGVTVKFGGKTLKKGVDYTVTYKNNTKKGTARLIVKGKGNFTGSKTITFKIR